MTINDAKQKTIMFYISACSKQELFQSVKHNHVDRLSKLQDLILKINRNKLIIIVYETRNK